MKYEITNHFPNEIIYEEEGPLVSLYQPTHRSFPENKQDNIVFGNLLRVIENSFNKTVTSGFCDCEKNQSNE